MFQSTAGIFFVEEEHPIAQSSSTETPDQFITSSPTGWIAGFAVILILFIIQGIIIVFLKLFWNKIPRDSQTQDPVTLASNDLSTETPASTYTGLQLSEVNMEGQEYTDLNTAKPTNVAEHDYSYANVNENKEDNENDYDYAETDIRPKIIHGLEQHQYGNVK